MYLIFGLGTRAEDRAGSRGEAGNGPGRGWESAGKRLGRGQEWARKVQTGQ